MSATQRLPAASKGVWAPAIKLVKPTHIMLLAASAVLLTHMVLGLSLVRQSKQEKILKEEAAVTARTNRSLLSVNLEQTQIDLTDAETKLAASRSAIPARSYTTEFVSDLLKIARDHNLEMVSLGSLDIKEQIVGVHKYQATPITIIVRGAKEDMIGFSLNLEHTDYPLLVRNTQLEGNGSSWDMTVDFDVYSRSSDETVKPAPATKPTAGSKK